MNFFVIIPARFYSTRFPGKLLADVQGKPMIVRVVEQAIKSGAQRVIVATDSTKIAHIIEMERSSAEICFTRSDHQSGTERLEEVVVRCKFLDHQIIVHLQGDEPLITSDMICQLVDAFLAANTSMATLAVPINSLQDAKDNNIVKVVVNINNHALYFSRSMIPWYKAEDFENHQSCMVNKLLLRHIGIYSYRVSFLHRYVTWNKSPLEQCEMLEQLRVLWQGETIYVLLLDHTVNIMSVDTPEALFYVNKLFKKNKE